MRRASDTAAVAVLASLAATERRPIPLLSGTARLAGVVMSLALALGVVVGAPLLAAVPIGSLVGLMLVVCHSTFNWSSLRLIGSIPAIDTAVLAMVSKLLSPSIAFSHFPPPSIPFGRCWPSSRSSSSARHVASPNTRLCSCPLLPTTPPLLTLP